MSSQTGSTNGGPKNGTFTRLKAKLFRRSALPALAVVDAHTANPEHTRTASVPSPSKHSASAEQLLLSQVSKSSITASTSMVHATDGHLPENQLESASIFVGLPGTAASEASSSRHPEASEPAVEEVSPPAQPLSPTRDLWQEALERLPMKTQQKIKKMGGGHPNSRSISQQIDDLLKVAKTKQEECEQKFWRFHVGDHEVLIRDYAVKIVGWLQEIGDIAIQFAPPQASLPWAAIKAVMQVRIHYPC
jgi:hypothetical protein